jgi:hypothetical protein
MTELNKNPYSEKDDWYQWKIWNEGYKEGQNNHNHTGFSCDECANLMKDDTWYMQSDEALAISEQVKRDMIEKFDKFLGQFVFWCGKDKSELLEKWDALKKEELI